MNNMMELVCGFMLLAQYDDSGGDVSTGRDGEIFAGPEDPENLAQISAKDAEQLEQRGWFFDENIERWGWRH